MRYLSTSALREIVEFNAVTKNLAWGMNGRFMRRENCKLKLQKFKLDLKRVQSTDYWVVFLLLLFRKLLFSTSSSVEDDLFSAIIGWKMLFVRFGGRGGSPRRTPGSVLFFGARVLELAGWDAEPVEDCLVPPLRVPFVPDSWSALGGVCLALTLAAGSFLFLTARGPAFVISYGETDLITNKKIL